ncbi:hypothetical protein ACHAXT_011669 [Thalassiosira profunda]
MTWRDDISILSDDRAFFRRARSRSRPRTRSTNAAAPQSSSQSVATSPTSSPPKASFFSRSRSHSRPRARRGSAPNSKQRSRSAARPRSTAARTAAAQAASPDAGANKSAAAAAAAQIASSDSAAQSAASSPAKSTGGSPSSLLKMKKKFARKKKYGNVDDVSVSDSLCSGVLKDLGSTFGSGMSVGSSWKTSGRRSSAKSIGASGRSIGDTGRTTLSGKVPGGVADFDLDYLKKGSGESSLSNGSPKPMATSPGRGEVRSLVSETISEDAEKREARKERVKEKLDRYKRDQKQLKQSCVALEKQLAHTTEKLKEVDSKAAFKIDSLESELRETRSGMEQVAKQSTKEVTDQSECIKTLGKKLIRQAHVIKRQKKAVEQYKMQLEGLHEEMAMQDERDVTRDDELERLQEEVEEAKERRIKMQNVLQENIEEMMDLKTAAEQDSKAIMSLEFDLQQKDATLKRVAREESDKSVRIAALEDDLERKDAEVKDVKEQLKAKEVELFGMKKEFESASEEAEELRCNFAAWGTTRGSSEGVEASPGRSASVSSAVSDGRPSMTGRRQSSLLWGKKALLEDVDPETFEAELKEKDTTIQTLNDTVTEQEETIKTLRSDMVKMSSTYKQDSYLKRKEIAKLKQMNAEYALKLRALEKAFKCVNSPANMEAISTSRHGHTSHGEGRSPGMGLNGSHHGSLHGLSLHSVGPGEVSSREDKAAAVRARLGGALYDFPAAEPQVVTDNNFFEGSDQASEDGRKGEPAEEG